MKKVWQMSGLCRAAAALAFFAAGCWVIVPAGAAQPQPGFNPKDAPKVFPKDGGRPGRPEINPSRPGDSSEEGTWTIVLGAFRGPDADELARLGLEKVQRVAGVTNAFIDRRVHSTIIAVGRYVTPASKEAEEDLKRIREIVAEGGRPFARAFLAPPERASAGGRPEYNLSSAHQQFGKAAKYTLQVGAYGPPNPTDKPTEQQRGEAMKAAESAAEQLRRDGELAFYYHGPNLSMVTIGVFDDDALKAPESLDLTALKKRFPNNLYNGAGIKEFKAGKSSGLVSSKLVRIPDSDGTGPKPPKP